jgi:hypothetical protein
VAKPGASGARPATRATTRLRCPTTDSTGAAGGDSWVAKWGGADTSKVAAGPESTRAEPADTAGDRPIGGGPPRWDAGIGVDGATPATAELLTAASVDDPVDVIDQPAPRYPAALEQAGIMGRVELEYVVEQRVTPSPARCAHC